MEGLKDFFGNELNIGDVVIYANGTKPHEQGMAYGILQSTWPKKDWHNGFIGCHVSPIWNGKVAKAERYRNAFNLIKCPPEFIPDYRFSVEENEDKA